MFVKTTYTKAHNKSFKFARKERGLRRAKKRRGLIQTLCVKE